MKRLSFGSWPFLHGAFREEPVSFHKLLHKLRDDGYDGVELGAYRPHPNPDTHDTPERRNQVREEVAEHGLAFSGVAPNLKAHSLVSVDSSDLYVEAFSRYADFAADLGNGTIRVDTVEPLAKLKPVPPTHIMIERAIRAFSDCARRASQRGLRVTWEFEPHLPLHEPDQILAVVDGVRGHGHANFGVLYDVSHAYVCSGGHEREQLHRLSDCINHVHLCDSDGTQDENGISRHLPFGQGRVDFKRLLPELANLPAVEWWTVDMCYEPDAWTAIGSAKKFFATITT
jgi:sugar phosphate isomerase/epimerase